MVKHNQSNSAPEMAHSVNILLLLIGRPRVCKVLESPLIRWAHLKNLRLVPGLQLAMIDFLLLSRGADCDLRFRGKLSRENK